MAVPRTMEGGICSLLDSNRDQVFSKSQGELVSGCQATRGAAKQRSWVGLRDIKDCFQHYLGKDPATEPQET